MLERIRSSLVAVGSVDNIPAPEIQTAPTVTLRVSGRSRQMVAAPGVQLQMEIQDLTVDQAVDRDDNWGLEELQLKRQAVEEMRVEPVH